LRGKHSKVEATTLPIGAEVVMDGVSGNAMEVIATIDYQKAKLIELNVLRSPDKEEYTRILLHPQAGYRLRESVRRKDVKPPIVRHATLTIDTSYSSTHPKALARPPEVAPVFFGKMGDQEPVTLRVFVDKSIVEVFVNDRQVAAVRVYPKRKDSTGVSLRAIGGSAELLSLDAWQMENIYK